MTTLAHPVTSVKHWLYRTQLGAYARVADPRTLRGLGLVAICSVLTSLLEVAALAATMPLIELLSGGDLEDAGIPGRVAEQFVVGYSRQSQTLIILGTVVGLLLAKVAATAVARWWSVGLITKGSTVATTNLMAAYLVAPLQFHSSRNSADATRTVALSINKIFYIGLLGISTVITESCMILLVGALLIVVSPTTALAAVVFFGVALAVFQRLSRHRAEELGRDRDETAGRGLMQIQEAIGALREIRLGGEEAGEIERFRRNRLRQRALERRLLFAAGYGRFYLEAVFLVGFGVIATVQLLTQQSDGVAGLAVILTAGFRLLPSAGRLMHAINDVREGLGSASIVTEELDAMRVERLHPPPKLPLPPSGDVNATVPARVELRNVTFAYDCPDRPAVAGLNVTVPAGESIAIVGVSGSGKSTTVDLISGLLEPDTGEVLVDGRPLSSIRPRPRIGYVAQDVFLIDATVRENIAFLDTSIDESALARGMHLAQMDQWIAALPDGLDTRIGERGALVSGGQRQRIGIARALYLDPALLILDEATSALDVDTETSLTAAIRSLSRAVTVVVVAHRLSTVRACDRIMVLSEGRCVGLGTYDELSRDHEMFSRWVSLAERQPSVPA